MTLQMDEQDRIWKATFDALPRGGAGGACPRAEVLSTWTKGPLPDEATAHLASCFACREEIVEVRRRMAEQGRTEAPRRDLYALMPARKLPAGWMVAAAAGVVFAIALAIALSGNEPSPPPRPVVVQPKPPPPPPPRETPPPAPPPEAPKPPVVPPPTPEKPSVPAPVKETPAVAKPTPEPEKPAPPPSPTIPEKPAPVLTRARLKGSLFPLAGSATTQMENEPWQAAKIGQARDFSGVVKIKAEVAATKFRVGPTTFFVQRGSEIVLTLEEGRTGVKLARGEAFFDVTPGRDPFEVESPIGLVSVKGTRFLVSETDVAVQRGAVQLNAIAVAAGERSLGGPAQKTDLTKRLAWVRALEDTIRIEADKMALQGGMSILADPTAGDGRAIGVKGPLKAGQDAVAEIAAKRKQPATYAVWIRLHWPHGVPSALTMTVGDAFTWSSKAVPTNPNWQWVRAGTTELPEQPFRLRLVDTQAGLRIDQIVLTSDPDFNPEGK
jgi:outer membrane biosynthesis protein TonB